MEYGNEGIFELYDSVIMECLAKEDSVTLKCLYMNRENVEITFENVSRVKNYGKLQGNTISHMKRTDDGYEIHFMNEREEPAFIHSNCYRVKWE